MANFTDITIITLDESRTHNPDPSKLLYDVYFTLSASPPAAWREIFDTERKFPRHTCWRRAWIEGAAIVVHAPLDEIEKYHFADLVEDVQNTNAKYREYLARKTEAAVQEKKQNEAEQGKIDDLKKRLGFDEIDSDEDANNRS